MKLLDASFFVILPKHFQVYAKKSSVQILYKVHVFGKWPLFVLKLNVQTCVLEYAHIHMYTYVHSQCFRMYVCIYSVKTRTLALRRIEVSRYSLYLPVVIAIAPVCPTVWVQYILWPHVQLEVAVSIAPLVASFTEPVSTADISQWKFPEDSLNHPVLVVNSTLPLSVDQLASVTEESNSCWCICPLFCPTIGLCTSLYTVTGCCHQMLTLDADTVFSPPTTTGQ